MLIGSSDLYRSKHIDDAYIDMEEGVNLQPKRAALDSLAGVFGL